MSKAVFSIAAVLALVAGPALAGHCPKDVKKIDAALAGNPKVSATMLAKAKSLRATGDSLHKSGKHGDSLKALHEAMDILKVKH